MNRHGWKRWAAALAVGLGLAAFGTYLPAAETSRTLYRNEPKEVKDRRMAWWREARFGMFNHWGLYSVLEGEWNGKTHYAEWIRHQAHIPIKTYEALIPRFNPTNFNARAWARMARKAGMKYLVITSKHHDGFCMWPSRLTDFDIAATPFGRDPLAELKKACDKEGIKFCLYYSIMDWHHPNYPPRKWEKDRSYDPKEFGKYVAYMKGQLKELVENYHPAVLWFDGQWESVWTHELGLELYEYVRSLDPDIIINNRVDKGRQRDGRTAPEHAGDFGTPEQHIPAKGLPGVDWETCMTMNGHWGWNKRDDRWKSPEDLVRKLVDISSKGGNFLLNIGPKPDGTFPKEAIERLDKIGAWMDVNQDAIYGTQASPFGKVPFGRVTWKPAKNRLYLHVFDWPKDGTLDLPGMASPVKKARLLANRWKRLKVSVPEENLVRISRLPADPPSPYVSVIVLTYKGTLKAIPYVKLTKAGPDGVFTLKAKDAELDGGQKYETDKDCIGFWMNTGRATWTLDVGKPGRYTVRLVYACPAASAGTPYQLTIGGKTLRGKAGATKGWIDFQTAEVGTVELAAGRQPVEIKPTKKPAMAFLNLRAIILTPQAR